MPYALRDASISARTFAAGGRAILKPIDFDEFIDADVERAN